MCAYSMIHTPGSRVDIWDHFFMVIGVIAIPDGHKIKLALRKGFRLLKAKYEIFLTNKSFRATCIGKAFQKYIFIPKYV